MTKATIDGNDYNLYDFVEDGIPGASTDRYIRTTVETLADSRTVTVTKKKRFSFALRHLTSAEVTQLNTTFAKNTFSVTMNPYNATAFTVKVVTDGNMPYLPNTTTYTNWEGITLEVISAP